MNRQILTQIALAAACTVLLQQPLTAASGGAIGASGNGPAPSTTTPVQGEDHSWTVGSKEDPVEVYHDETEGPWKKVLTPAPGNNGNGNGNTPAGASSDGNNEEGFRLTEYLEIAKGPDWVDWHEEIKPDNNDTPNNDTPSTNNVVTPGWTWGDEGIIFKAKKPGEEEFSTPDNLDVSISEDEKSIWFDFEPLPEGTKIKISKPLEHEGGVLEGSDAFDNLSDFNENIGGPGAAIVHQYPTIPTPAGMGLGVGLFGCLLGLRTPRHRS